MIECKMKRLFVFLVLPLIFGARTDKPAVSSNPRNQQLFQRFGQPHTPVYQTPSPANMSLTPMTLLSDSGPKVDYYESIRAREDFVQIPNEIRAANMQRFNALRDQCSSGQYRVLPTDTEFILSQDPTDYLALAIEAQNPEAIAACKDFIYLEYSSSYLQSTLIDLILCENTTILEYLGKTYPKIFTHIFSFYEPYSVHSGSSLIRIAVDQRKDKAAIAMFQAVPASVISDFWRSLSTFRGFVIESLETKALNLKAKPGETEFDPAVLKDIFYNCVVSGNLKALEHLCNTTDVDLKTKFEEEKTGMEFSAMYVAAYTGYSEMVTFLGKRCPDLYRIPTNTGMLPIHVAALNGHDKIIKLMDEAAPDTFTAKVLVNGIEQTPFSIAIRNKRRVMADIILSFIDDPKLIKEEMSRLAIWAILDDNPKLLEIYFEYGVGKASGIVEGSKFNVLEMAVHGTFDPAVIESKRCKIKCLEYLIQVWKRLKLPFEVEHGNVRGSILGLVKPTDIDAFVALVRFGGIDPNAPIIEYSTGADGQVLSYTTTFLNRIIAQGATELIPIAIKYGADPRIIDDEGDESIAVSLNHKNDFALKYLETL